MTLSLYSSMKMLNIFHKHTENDKRAVRTDVAIVRR